ncbi:hypothetical protein [Adhaeribacter terreus]|uniref:Lipocalin-like domain-containing protein n=1 Tax=Adhaeribacter terreus TaxID=529703 RepID=A0ABW0ECT4_9BACT
MKNFYFLVLLAFTLGLTSCNDNSDKDPAPIVQPDPADDPAAIELTKQLLTTKKWRLIALTQNVAGQAIYTDLYNNSYPSCQQDDLYIFETQNNTLKIEVGFGECTPAEPDRNGSWNLKNANTLTITDPNQSQTGLTGDFSITQLNDTKMILKQTVNGNEYTATYEIWHSVAKIKLLTSKPWKLSAMTMQSPGGQPTDVFSSMPACERDNIIDIRWTYSYNQYYLYEGPTKCNPSDPYNIGFGYWFLNKNDTELVLDGSVFEVMQLTATTLVLREEYNGTIGISTYIH